MWVFTYKFDTDDYLDRYKARLVLRGDLVRYTDEDTYAATLAARVLRALLAIAAYFGLELKQLDAVNAFINALSDEVLYTTDPGIVTNIRNGICLLINRALYSMPKSLLL